MQKHEDDVRAATLTAEISALRSKLAPTALDGTADTADGDTIAALPSAHAGIEGAADQRAAQVTVAGSVTVVERVLREKMCSSSTRGRAGLDAGDLASIYKCIGEVRALRETVAEREQEVTELKRSRQHSQAQYELLRQEHTEVLGRLDALLAAGAGAQGGQDGASSAATDARLAAAERAAALLRDDLAACEARLADARQVRDRAADLRHF